MKKVYRGWITVEKSPGFKDHFSCEWFEHGVRKYKAIGYGRAAEAVDHFETTLLLGPIKLESTPVGLRVYTEEQVQPSDTP